MNVKSWISSKVVLLDSPIHGKGLFAKKKILKDEVVAYKGGYLIELDEFRQLSDECKSAGLQIDKNYSLRPDMQKR